MADLTSIGAHSNSFTISDQISFLCGHPPIAAALLPRIPAARATKGKRPLKEEFVGASLRARSQSTFTDFARYTLRVSNTNTNKRSNRSSSRFWAAFAPQYSPWPLSFGFFSGPVVLTRILLTCALRLCAQTLASPSPSPSPSRPEAISSAMDQGQCGRQGPNIGPPNDALRMQIRYYCSYYR